MTPDQMVAEYKTIEKMFFNAITSLVTYWCVPLCGLGCRAKLKDGNVVIEVHHDIDWTLWTAAPFSARCAILCDAKEILDGMEYDGKERLRHLTVAKEALSNWKSPTREGNT